MKIPKDIITIIDEGRNVGMQSGRIAEMIFNDAFVDNTLVVVEDQSERPVNFAELITIARKAIEQAWFDGAIVLLPSKKIIRRKERSYPALSPAKVLKG